MYANNAVTKWRKNNQKLIIGQTVHGFCNKFGIENQSTLCGLFLIRIKYRMLNHAINNRLYNFEIFEVKESLLLCVSTPPLLSTQLELEFRIAF